jgi:hypothetical protein
VRFDGSGDGSTELRARDSFRVKAAEVFGHCWGMGMLGEQLDVYAIGQTWRCEPPRLTARAFGGTAQMTLFNFSCLQNEHRPPGVRRGTHVLEVRENAAQRAAGAEMTLM